MELQQILILTKEDLVPTPQPIALVDLKPVHFKPECYNKIRTVPITLFDCEDGTHTVLTTRFVFTHPIR